MAQTPWTSACSWGLSISIPSARPVRSPSPCAQGPHAGRPAHQPSHRPGCEQRRTRDESGGVSRGSLLPVPASPPPALSFQASHQIPGSRQRHEPAETVTSQQWSGMQPRAGPGTSLPSMASDTLGLQSPGSELSSAPSLTPSDRLVIFPQPKVSPRHFLLTFPSVNSQPQLPLLVCSHRLATRGAASDRTCCHPRRPLLTPPACHRSWCPASPTPGRCSPGSERSRGHGGETRGHSSELWLRTPATHRSAPPSCVALGSSDAPARPACW